MTRSLAMTRPDRRVRRGEPLRGGDHVRPDVVALGSEPRPDPAEAGDDLVGAEQDPVAVADLANAGPVAVGRREGPAGVLHRLHDHHRDCLGPGLEDRLLEVVEQERCELLLRLLVRAVVAVRVADVERVGHERLERRLEGRDPVDRERSHRRPVVGDPPRDRLPAALAARGVVLAGELPGGLDRLGAAGDEEDPVQVAGGERGDLGRQLDRARMRVAPVGVERQLAHLRRGRLPDLLAESVPDVDGEEAGERVEVALAVDVLEVAAVTANDDRHLAVRVAGHAGEVQPQVVSRSLLQFVCGQGGRGEAHTAPFFCSTGSIDRSA